ncbi:hypothetical protein [Streptomyces acidiscabies]|uniref:hypothetical protein n=1 Tax=Streptomyces acidiscabies TaxID=42234 RepID=UPI0009528B17|nr:hypothetical protein [Streptomyces acidiscabies]
MFKGWQDVDPARHPFDPDTALPGVREVVSSSAGSECSVALGLGERFGRWAYRALDAVDEHRHSGALIRELPAHSDDPEQLARRYTSVLLQWRTWLEDLAAAFAALAPAPDADADEIRKARARAVAPLVTLVVERTDAGELWLPACEDAIAWYLETTGMPAIEAEELADTLVDSEFRSWVSPDAEAVGRVRSAIGAHDA